MYLEMDKSEKTVLQHSTDPAVGIYSSSTTCVILRERLLDNSLTTIYISTASGPSSRPVTVVPTFLNESQCTLYIMAALRSFYLLHYGACSETRV